MTILVSALIWTLRKPIEISRTWVVTLMFAAIGLFVVAGLTSCDNHHECRGRQYVSSPDISSLPLVQWEDVFGPRGPMEVEVGGGRVEIRHVPVGMMIRWDSNSNQAWNTDGCRVRISERVSGSEPYQQPMQHRQQMMPQHRQNIQPYPPQYRQNIQPYQRQQRW